MPFTSPIPSEAAPDQHSRLQAAMRLQEIEGNPLTAAEVALFEGFERANLSADRRRELIMGELGPAPLPVAGALNPSDPYRLAGAGVLANRLGLVDAAQLDRAERLLVVQRAVEGPPIGGFDLAHLRAIHRHLLQDLFDWAGEIRTVEISKGGHQFQFRQFIETGMADVHRRLVKSRFLAGLGRQAFAEAAARILGDVNFVHPFREGNGRTQLHYLAQLGDRAGHPVDLTQLTPAGWIAASRAANDADYSLMAEEISRAIR